MWALLALPLAFAHWAEDSRTSVSRAFECIAGVYNLVNGDEHLHWRRHRWNLLSKSPQDYMGYEACLMVAFGIGREGVVDTSDNGDKGKCRGPIQSMVRGDLIPRGAYASNNIEFIVGKYCLAGVERSSAHLKTPQPLLGRGISPIENSPSVDGNLNGGSISDVSNNDSDLKIGLGLSEAHSWLVWSGRHSNLQPSSLASNERIAGKFSGVFGCLGSDCSRSPHFLVGNPQREGESRNDDSGESGDARVMPINEAPRTTNVAGDDSLESGVIFFGGAIGFGVALLAYAALKEWRGRSFDDNK
jgi:hypothetical protein